MNLIKELRWRGLVQDIMPGTEEQLSKEVTAGYVGFDPTADSLHIGSLVPILLLVHLQKAGHKPFALVGGATGMVGDPSGKSAERNLLSEEVLQKNMAGIKAQLMQFLDFTPGPTAAEMVNNYDWFKDMSFLQFIRDIGKHITVNYMMSKDSVKKRIEGEAGISFTEFTYQLIQGYDFYWLYQNKNCKLQMGGSDQWGNIVTGTELIRRKAGGEAFAFTCPLLTKSDGSKFGKSEGGNVWLDASKTPVFKFYQFWLNAHDEDAKKWIKVFTFLKKDEIDRLIVEHDFDRGKRLLQKKLAEEITGFVHGSSSLSTTIQTTQKLFGNQNASTDGLSINDLEKMEGIKLPYAMSNLQAGVNIIDLVFAIGIFPSKSEARKMIQNLGLSLNREKVIDPQMQVNTVHLLHGKYLLLQKGRKQYYLVTATN